MMNEWEKAVYETGFAMDDILLYLDTHPKDQRALAYYEETREAWKQARCAYIENVGPLAFADVVDANQWTWIERPWPWEGGMCACGLTRNASHDAHEDFLSNLPSRTPAPSIPDCAPAPHKPRSSPLTPNETPAPQSARLRSRRCGPHFSR